MKEDELTRKRGNIGTFIIRVTHQQNSTWQGVVTWSEKNMSVPFKSVLELLKLMDSVINEDGKAASLKKPIFPVQGE